MMHDGSILNKEFANEITYSLVRKVGNIISKIMLQLAEVKK